MRYRQRRDGHRTGIEPVLLAASVPARAGDHVIEGGAGAGAATLCLLARVGGTRATAIECDPVLAALARRNLAANGWHDRAAVLEATIPSLPPLAPAQHGFANPPWFDRRATGSADARRALARVLPDGGLTPWAIALGRAIVRGGTLALIVPAARLGDAAAALGDAGFGARTVFPLWPRPGRSAKLLIIKGRNGARGPDRLEPGLVLHGPDGRYTAAADALLRGGAGLDA